MVAAKILIVDDQPENLIALEALLQADDRELLLARNGAEALRIVLREDLALVLLDVHMPDMEGDEVARALRSRERSRHVPIIMLTASAPGTDALERSYEAGAVDHLNKPVHPLILESKVKVFVELYEQRKRLAEVARQMQENERLERALELERLRSANERRFKVIANAIPAIVWSASASGDFTYFNDTWFEYTGFSAGDGRTLAEAMHPDDAVSCRQSFARAMQAGDPFEVRCRLKRRDDTFRWHVCRSVPMKVEGQVSGWFGTAADIDDLIAAQQSAEKAVRIRDEFLSIAAHELRTPLTSMALSVDALSRATPEVAPKSAKIKKQIRRLNQLVETLLDVSRISEGRVSLQREPMDLSRVVSDVAARFKEELNGEAHLVEAKIEPGVHGEWDPLRVEQIAINLLSNAVKYGGGKPVEISLRKEDGAAVLDVADQGIGIEPEHLERIFGKFERAVSVDSYGGLGLGLYISRQLVAAHGGELSVESKPGEGSVFRVKLPLKAADSR